MLSGIEIAIERMRTHPEEFVVENKYNEAFRRVMPYLSDEEKQALRAALNEAHRAYFTGEVMSIMAGESEERTMQTSVIGTAYARPSLADYVFGDQSHVDADLNRYAKSILERSTGTISGGTITANLATTPSPFGAVPISAERANAIRKQL